MRGLSHVWRKEKAFHRRKRVFAFRRLEKGRKARACEVCTDCIGETSIEIINTLGSREHTGLAGGELKEGVGSRVDSAEAPVSPRSSAPRLLDFRRGRGLAWAIEYVLEVLVGAGSC